MAKYLIFHDDNDDTICLPTSRLLAVDQTDSTSVLLKFESKNATAGAVTTIDLTVAAGKEMEAFTSLMKKINSDVDVETIWNKSSMAGADFSAISIDSSGNNSNGLVKGAGFTGTGSYYNSWIERNGSVIKTSIMIDITGLNSGGADGDIIGLEGTTDGCHIGLFETAKSGTPFEVTVRNLNVLGGGDDFLDFYEADVATGAEDTAVTSLTGATELLNGAQLNAVDVLQTFSTLPTDGHYLYIAANSNGGTPADDTYSSGKILIEIFGTE